MQWIMFSKMLQPCESLEKVADVLCDIGLDGVDFTVRPKGHVEPEDVKEKLPAAVKVFESRGLKMPMITTMILRGDEPHAEDTFATAADCGVQYMKLGYWRYGDFGTLKEQLEAAKEDLATLAPLARKHGVTAAVHVHSGAYLSADPILLWEMIRDFDPKEIGAYLDAGHMCIDGWKACWKLGMDMLSDRVAMVAVKDLAPIKPDTPGDPWKSEVVPVGQGMTPWREFFACLKQTPFDGPITIHSEYKMDSVEELVAQTKTDFAFFKEASGG